MILGIGNDITAIARIEEGLARFGQKFEDRIFTAGEQHKAHTRDKAGAHAVAATYAKRFAAKEACAKALGLGIRGMRWCDIEVQNDEHGTPSLVLHGGAKERLTAITPAGMTAKLWLSLSDEEQIAQAFVIIEAL